MEYKPLARSYDLTAQFVGDETLIYDLRTQKMKILNKTTSAVWRLCDGEHSLNDITRKLSEEFQLYVDPAIVLMAFDQMWREDLLEENSIGVTTEIAGQSETSLAKIDALWLERD